jgi:monoamine oxidase
MAAPAKRGAKRVIVLGGGVAGLSAAHELRRLSPGIELRLLEARQLLGGRVLTERDPVSGEPLELGAEFVHGRPPEFLRALREAGMAVEGEGGRGDSGDSPFALLPKLLAPFLSSGAPDETIAAFLAKQDLTPRQRGMLRGYVEGFYVAPFERASARAIARMEVAAAGIRGGHAAQLPGGYDALVRWLAAALRPGELSLGAHATGLAWKPGQVVVRAVSLAGARLEPLRAEAAIVALPFSALSGRAGALSLSPRIPEKHRAASALRMGHATKVFLRFDGSLRTDPFFFSGGRIPVWWPAAALGTRWLVGWAGGPAAEALERVSDAVVLRAGLAAIAVHTGRKPRALAQALTGFRCVRWSRQPFIEGAYAVVPLGADGAMQTLAEPVENTLYFAGEATDPEHAGTVHGAFDSGVRAARQVLSGSGPRAGLGRRPRRPPDQA